MRDTPLQVEERTDELLPDEEQLLPDEEELSSEELDDVELSSSSLELDASSHFFSFLSDCSCPKKCSLRGCLVGDEISFSSGVLFFFLALPSCCLSEKSIF